MIIKIYGVALAFLTILAPVRASTTILWSGPQDILMGPGAPEWPSSSAFYSLDLDDNGTTDYEFSFFLDGIFRLSPEPDSFVTAEPAQAGGIICQPLAALTLIGDSLDAPTQWSGDEYELIIWRSFPGPISIGSGPWHGVDRQYAGLQFQSDGEVHYGWVEMSGLQDYEGAIIHSWAYNTVAGESIMTGVVPEPSTIVLFAIGFGVMGGRRRLRGKPQ